MKKLFFTVFTVLIASVAWAQEPDTTKVEPKETPQQPETPQQQVEPKTSQPKIIYYQTTPDERDESRYQSRYKDRDRNRREIKTLSGSMNHSGGFGALSFRATDFRDETMVLAGFRGGWIINRTLGIGVEGHGIIPTATFDDIIPNDEAVILGGYGGMFLELILFSNQVVHITFPVSGGAGWLGYLEDWENNNPTVPNQDDTPGNQLIDEDIFWYVEPGANLEVNISRNFRLAFGASQRFTQDLELIGTETNAFDNLNYYITLKIGSF